MSIQFMPKMGCDISMNKDLEMGLENIWKKLEYKISQGKYDGERLYQRLDLEKETGIRLAIRTSGTNRELLIQLASNDIMDFSPPQWVGMRFNVIKMDTPKKGTRHISLYLDDRIHSDVFSTVSEDIIKTLLHVDRPEHRSVKLLSCLEKWNRFFNKHGIEGLSRESQRGLYGEVFWLRRLLNGGMDTLSAIKSWQGCGKNYNDFEFVKKAVEVKTTISKEPRKIFINNERQLDDRGFNIMFLYVLTLQQTIAENKSLPVLIDDVRSQISDDITAKEHFELKLNDAGYLEIHRPAYITGYIVKSEEIFEVKYGFPRIIDLPAGTGDISYSLTISACSSFSTDIKKAIKAFMGGELDG